MIPVDAAIGLIADAFWSGLAALGFAILFNVPRRFLVACAICGAAGHAVRAALVSAGGSLEFGTLVGATVVGFASLVYSRRYGAPASIFAVCGAIPMVPGVFAYRTMIGLLNVASVEADQSGPLLVEAGANAVKTTLLLGAIALGIAAPSLLFRRPRPVV